MIINMLQCITDKWEGVKQNVLSRLLPAVALQALGTNNCANCDTVNAERHNLLHDEGIGKRQLHLK